MTYAIPSKLLRASLASDAAASGMLAVLQIVAAPAASLRLGLSEGLLLATGLLSAVYAVLLFMLARSGAVSRALVVLVAAGNVGWCVACIALAAALRADLTPLGSGYVLLQAVAVVGFAGTQMLGLKRSRNAPRMRPLFV